MPHSMVHSLPQSAKQTTTTPGKTIAELVSTGLPSQTNESKPTILIVPPRNPLRNAKRASTVPSSFQAKRSHSVHGGEYSVEGLHSSFSTRRNQGCAASNLSEPAESERGENNFRFSGYWEELKELPSQKEPMSGSDTRTQHGSEDIDRLMDKALSPKPLKLQPPKSQAKANTSVATSVTADSTKMKHTFWSRIRNRRKSFSIFTTEAESVPPLSPGHSSRSKHMSFAESESSGCSMHTPTSSEYHGNGRLLPFEECLAFGLGLEGGNVKSERPLGLKKTLSTKSGLGGKKQPVLINITPVLSIKENSVPFKSLRTRELPHILTVVIPDGKLFEDDFLHMISFS